MKTPRKNPIRVSHYGTGKSPKSPVLIRLPEELDVPYFVGTVEFAEAVQEAYEFVESASDFHKFSSSLNYLRNTVKRGAYSDLRGAMNERVQSWREHGDAGYFDGVARTAEEKLQDKMGELAAWAEIKGKVTSRSSIYSYWHESTRVFDLRRAVIDTTAAAAMISAVVWLGLATGEWAWLTALMFGFLFLRFSRPVQAKMEVTPFHWHAYYVYPGDYKAKRPLVKAMVAGETQEQIYARVREALEATMLEDESRQLALSISEEFATQEELLALEEAKRTPPNPLLPLLVSDEPTSTASTIQAQRALLAELRDRNAALQG